MLTYDIPWYKDGSNLGSDARATKNTHMFKVQCNTASSPVTIRVTDTFGNVYEQIVKRPVAFSLSAIDTATAVVTGIKEVRHRISDDARISAGNGCVRIHADHVATARIVSLNGRLQSVRLSAGDNEIPVKERGIYIVSVGGQARKVFVR